MLAVEGRQQTWQTHPRHALLHAHRQGAAQQPPYRVDGIPRGPCPRQRPLGLHQQRVPGLRQPHAARGAAEQRRPELVFQGPDGGGEPGLRHGEALGGTGEVLFLGDGDEVFQLTQLHD